MRALEKQWLQKENYHKGALPLIHNISKSNCEALDDVLSFLEEKKYRFGTLDEFTINRESNKKLNF